MSELLADLSTRSLLDPLVGFDSISLDEANAALVAWDHKMGAFRRPNYGNRVRAHGLRHDGELLALTITDRAISEEVAGMDRGDILELARVCAARRDLNRVVLRLWREFVFPAIAREWGATWAISYQHVSELKRLLARGPILKVACHTLDEWHQARFREECRWASWVDDLQAELDGYWREALRTRIAWACAAGGWIAAATLAVTWWLYA